jgi:hypothetical protein
MAETAPTPREMLFVQSKVRDELRRRELRVSEEFLGSLNEALYGLVERAATRCLANRRRTLDASDV